jgi:hypothetical protein
MDEYIQKSNQHLLESNFQQVLKKFHTYIIRRKIGACHVNQHSSLPKLFLDKICAWEISDFQVRSLLLYSDETLYWIPNPGI